jgi:hypothetical protein
MRSISALFITSIVEKLNHGSINTIQSFKKFHPKSNFKMDNIFRLLNQQLLNQGPNLYISDQEPGQIILLVIALGHN